MIRDMFGNELTLEQAIAAKRKHAPKDRSTLIILRQQAGLHPHRGDKLGPAGETCGSCKHHKTRTFAKRYHKCDLGPDSFGPATDVRLRWPACDKWAPHEAPQAPKISVIERRAEPEEAA